jgi:hypothetical protein
VRLRACRPQEEGAMIAAVLNAAPINSTNPQDNL